MERVYYYEWKIRSLSDDPDFLRSLFSHSNSYLCETFYTHNDKPSTILLISSIGVELFFAAHRCISTNNALSFFWQSSVRVCGDQKRITNTHKPELIIPYVYSSCIYEAYICIIPYIANQLRRIGHSLQHLTRVRPFNFARYACLECI